MQQASIGVIGLSVMGANLAQNFEKHGNTVAVFNRTADKTTTFAAAHAGRNFIPATRLEDFVNSLATPRKIIIMVKAGAPVDEMIDQLLPLTAAGDILIDCGNSHFLDTNRRVKKVEAAGKLYVGCGVSGGEEGALNGPSLMPGGSAAAWPVLQPLFEAIAAKVGPNDEPCCTWIGEGGSGHFVKMVHNGIEYADLQLIAESYSLMKTALGMPQEEMAATFEKWNEGDLKSYLIEITSKVLLQKDTDSEGFLVDKISDVAGQKGTGKWTAQTALDLGVAIPTIIEAVNVRFMSTVRNERMAAKSILIVPSTKFSGDKAEVLSSIQDALYASKVISYAQGFALMQAAARFYSWKLDFSQITAIWRGGCIIRAELLNEMMKAFSTDQPSANLMTEPFFANQLVSRYSRWQSAVVTGIETGLALPAFSSALAYFNEYRTDSLPTNLIQGQRDFFGAHTYERTDKSGSFHTEWQA